MTNSAQPQDNVPPVPTQTIRSEYWNSGRTIVLSAVSTKDRSQIVLFRENVDVLSRYSSVLDDILNIPASPDSTEGTEGNPIVLPDNISAETFHICLRFFHDRSLREYKVTPANILTLLELGSLFEMPLVLAFAIPKLPLLNLDPVEVLSLAQKYHVRHGVKYWIRGAIEQLLPRRLSDYTKEDERKVGKAYSLIACTREDLDRRRRYLAVRPYTLVSTTGSTNHEETCLKAWNFGWYQRVTPNILHPERPPITWGGLIQLVERTTFPFLRDSCKKATIEQMRLFQNFPHASQLVDRLVEDIITVYKIEKDEPKKIPELNEDTDTEIEDA
ncbi:hypothetical protein FB446DRAFT_795842 [Lentinula raphanica]|nr:hypothetical protein FB446DRAFT_795842 [Lentinula raphanica]